MIKNVGPLAQLVEQLAFNQLVAGSNPARPTKYKKASLAEAFLYLLGLTVFRSSRRLVRQNALAFWTRRLSFVEGDEARRVKNAAKRFESIQHGPSNFDQSSLDS